MHGETYFRWLKGKEIERNLKDEGKVDNKQNDKKARSTNIIGKVGWKGGKEKFFRPTQEDAGQAGKKEGGRGVSGEHSHYSHYAT